MSVAAAAAVPSAMATVMRIAGAAAMADANDATAIGWHHCFGSWRRGTKRGGLGGASEEGIGGGEQGGGVRGSWQRLRLPAQLLLLCPAPPQRQDCG
eukprot:1158760-Pelagomonas_calceolata.AAC.11